MKKETQKKEPITLRIIVAGPRSGSNMLLRIIENIPDDRLAVTSRLVSEGHKNMVKLRKKAKLPSFVPDYRIFNDKTHTVLQQAENKKRTIIISKEEFGNNKEKGTPECNECNYAIFPNQSAILKTKPIFLFRHPLTMFDCWKKLGWCDIESFLLVYHSLFKTYRSAKAAYPSSFCFTYEFLVQEDKGRSNILQMICNLWGLPYNDKIFFFEKDFGHKFIFQSQREVDIFNENPKGILSTVRDSKTILRDTKGSNLVTPEEKKIILVELNDLYQRVENEMHSAMSQFAQKNINSPLRSMIVGHQNLLWVSRYWRSDANQTPVTQQLTKQPTQSIIETKALPNRPKKKKCPDIRQMLSFMTTQEKRKKEDEDKDSKKQSWEDFCNIL